MLYATELIIGCVFFVPVLILTTTVVCMKLQVGLSQVMCLQKVVHHANYGVCPFSSLCSLVNKVVNLKNNKHRVIQVFFYLEHIYTCRGIPSQHTPNIAHFSGVKSTSDLVAVDHRGSEPIRCKSSC